MGISFKYYDVDPNNLSRGRGLYYNRGGGNFCKFNFKDMKSMKKSERDRLKKLIDSGQLDVRKILKNDAARQNISRI